MNKSLLTKAAKTLPNVEVDGVPQITKQVTFIGEDAFLEDTISGDKVYIGRKPPPYTGPKAKSLALDFSNISKINAPVSPVVSTHMKG